MRRSWIGVAVAVWLAACNSSICARQTDCPAGDMCSSLGMCEAAIERIDAAVGDAGPADAAVDAIAPDAVPDAAIDAAVLDAPLGDAL